MEHFKPASVVPAYLTVIDIAGLVKGAAEGQGLGNAFLSHVRAVDGLFHILRCFDDDEIVHVDGEVNPVRDLETITEELRKKDAAFLEKELPDLSKAVARLGQTGDKTKKEELETLKKVHDWVVEQKKEVRKGDWNAKDVEWINTWYLLTAKPVVILVNLTEKDFSRKKNKWLAKIKAWVDENAAGDPIIPFSVAVEQHFSELKTQEEKDAYAKELQEKYELEKPVTSVLPKIIVSGYQAMSLQYFFTGGADEVRAWTIRKGFKAPQAAGTMYVSSTFTVYFPVY